MASKLKPVLILGIAGGVVAALRKRSDKASELASRAADAAPQPVKQAVETAVDKVSDAVSNATGSDDSQDSGDTTPRYAAPAEAGAQPPAESGGAPSDDPQATVARSVPAEELHTKPHDLPAGVVMPDVSDDDPSVREAEAAAEADAASIGRNADENQP